MEVAFDPKTGLPRLTLSKEDIEDARRIKRTMDSSGWKVLSKYLEVARESIIDAGKDGIRTRGKKDLSPEKWAVLKGFDEARHLPNRIIARADEFLKSEVRQEDKNEDPNDDEQR